MPSHSRYISFNSVLVEEKWKQPHLQFMTSVNQILAQCPRQSVWAQHRKSAWRQRTQEKGYSEQSVSFDALLYSGHTGCRYLDTQSNFSFLKRNIHLHRYHRHRHLHGPCSDSHHLPVEQWARWQNLIQLKNSLIFKIENWLIVQ